MVAIGDLFEDLREDVKRLSSDIDNKLILKKENDNSTEPFASDMSSFMLSFQDLIVTFIKIANRKSQISIDDNYTLFIDIYSRLYNIGVKTIRLEVANKCVVEIFKQLAQIPFCCQLIVDKSQDEDPNCDQVINSGADSDGNLNKIQRISKLAFQVLTERYYTIGEYKKALTVLALAFILAEGSDENVYQNLLLIIRKRAREAESNDFTYSLIQSLEFKDMFISAKSKFYLNYDHLSKLREFELKTILEKWPRPELLSMITDCYYNFIDSRMEMSNIIWLFFRLFSSQKQIPQKWVEKWANYFATFLTLKCKSIVRGLMLLFQYKISLNDYANSEMLSYSMNDYLAVYDFQLNDALTILYELTDDDFLSIPFPSVFNNFMKTIIFDCHFNEFCEYGLKASIIFYRFNKAIKNHAETLLISGYLIEKLNGNSELFNEILETNRNYSMDTCSDKHWNLYWILFRLKLCKLKFNQLKIAEATSMLNDVKRDLNSLGGDKKFSMAFSIYLETFDYLQFMLPCQYHPEFRYKSEIILSKIVSCVGYGLVGDTYQIDVSLILDTLNVLISYQKDIELSSAIYYYYQMLECIATGLKCYKLYEKAQYLILLNHLRYKPLKDLDSLYKSYIRISIIDYQSHESNDDLERNLSKSLANIHLRDAAIKDEYRFDIKLENTSKTLQNHSRKMQKSLSNIIIFLRNLHISIIYNLMKSMERNRYLENIFNIGYELQNQYNKCIDVDYLKNTSNYVQNHFLDVFLVFLFDYATYLCSFKHYHLSLKVCKQILTLAPDDTYLVHVKLLKQQLECELNNSNICQTIQKKSKSKSKS